MSQKPQSSTRSASGEKYRLAFVQANWHSDIVDQAKIAFLAEVHDVAEVEIFQVPGAFELPLHVKVLADTGRFDAVVAAGFVVDGGIYRHEFVAEAVVSGLMRVQLDSGVPVFSSVLTPQQFHESADHVDFFKNHMIGKGTEVAGACLATLAARDLVAA